MLLRNHSRCVVLSSLVVGVNRLERRHGAGSSSWRVGQRLKEGIVLLQGGESRMRSDPSPLSHCGLEACCCGLGLLSLKDKSLVSAGERVRERCRQIDGQTDRAGTS